MAARGTALLGEKSPPVVIFTSELVIPAIVGSLAAPPFEDSTPEVPVETWLFRIGQRFVKNENKISVEYK